MILSILVILASAEDYIEIECDYFTLDTGEYVCIVEDVEVRDHDIHVTFIGEHVPGFTEEDVVAFAVLFSDMRFIVPEIFKTFPNLIELDFAFAGLQYIDPFPEMPSLIAFICLGNDIRVIQNGTFANVGSSLLLLDLEYNNIQELEPGAFEGLDELLILGLMENSISNLPEGIFWPMNNAIIMDLESNNFGVIGETLFERNTQLAFLVLDNTGIDRIAPTFFGPLKENLEILSALGNICVNRGFLLDDEVVESFMHGSLRNCYNNFVGIRTNETNFVSIEFKGSLRLFDESGNLIFSAN